METGVVETGETEKGVMKMGCKYNRDECPGLMGCHRCPRNPDRVERVKYPSEREEKTWDLKRWLPWYC